MTNELKREDRTKAPDPLPSVLPAGTKWKVNRSVPDPDRQYEFELLKPAERDGNRYLTRAYARVFPDRETIAVSSHVDAKHVLWPSYYAALAAQSAPAAEFKMGDRVSGSPNSDGSNRQVGSLVSLGIDLSRVRVDGQDWMLWNDSLRHEPSEPEAWHGFRKGERVEAKRLARRGVVVGGDAQTLYVLLDSGQRFGTSGPPGTEGADRWMPEQASRLPAVDRETCKHAHTNALRDECADCGMTGLEMRQRRAAQPTVCPECSMRNGQHTMACTRDWPESTNPVDVAFMAMHREALAAEEARREHRAARQRVIESPHQRYDPNRGKSQHYITARPGDPFGLDARIAAAKQQAEAERAKPGKPLPPIHTGCAIGGVTRGRTVPASAPWDSEDVDDV